MLSTAPSSVTGIVLVGALFGAATSLRHSLHVIPGTPGYGSPVLGMHYYTWAFILFAATILAVAVLLMMWCSGVQNLS